MMSAQVVQDSVNKYSHGVLIGNFAEQQFGRDSVNRGRDNIPLTNISTMKATHRLDNSLHKFHPVITPQDKRTQTFYGVKSVDGRTKEPEKETTYDIFYRKQYPKRVPVVPNEVRKEERLDKERELFGHTKGQLENTSLRKTAGKFHYRKDVNDPVVEGGEGVGMGSGQFGGRTTGNLQEDGEAMTSAIHGTGEGDDETPVGVGNNKIGQIRAQSLNPSRLSQLLDKAQASKAPKKPNRDQQSNIKLGGSSGPAADQDQGQQSHILFGHGLTIDKFHSRQFATTYDLSYNQKIKPQTQINSFFKPDMTQTAKEFHRDTFYEKNHQSKIPQFNNRKELYNDKLCRPYAPYTKTFDLKHMKNQYLRK